FTPPPWRAITTPWKTWTRSLLPSTTFTWTLRVSPETKSGTSSRRLLWSMRSVGFLTVSSSGVARRGWRSGGVHEAGWTHGPTMLVAARRTGKTGTDPRSAAVAVPALGAELLQQALLLGREAAARLDEVGPAPQRAGDRLRPPPAGDAAVVAGAQHLGHPQAAVLRRPRVLRVLQQPRPERLLLGGVLVAHHPRHEPRHGLDHHERRHLPAGEHVVADRQLVVDEVGVHPLVDALVAPAEQGERSEEHTSELQSREKLV